MGRTPAVDSAPRQPPVATDSQPPAKAPIVVADRGDSPPVKAGRSGDKDKYAPPPSPVSSPPPRLVSSMKEASDTQEAVVKYLKGRLNPGDASKLASSLAKAVKAVDADALVQSDVRQRYSNMQASVDPASFERNIFELTQNVEEANRLKYWVGDIPVSEVRRGIAEVTTMQMRGAGLQLSEAEQHLVDATRYLRNIKFAPHKDRAQEKKAEAEVRKAEAKLQKAMGDARSALTKLHQAETDADQAWTSAKKEATGGEVKACADGDKKFRDVQRYLDEQVENVEKLLTQSRALLAQSANPSAGQAAEQAARRFHETEVAWLDEAYKMRDRLAREDYEQSARHDQGVAEAEANAANREQEVRQDGHILHDRQMRGELRAIELKDSLSRRDAADEVERRARKQARIAADGAKPD
jgi:hypothetical protein